MKKKLVETLILVRPNFKKTFILDVEWSIKNVGIIMSQSQDNKKKLPMRTKGYCLHKEYSTQWRVNVMP
jgi:hypothetical protein